MTQPIKAVIDSTVFVSAAIAIDAGRPTAARTLVEDALIRHGIFDNCISTTASPRRSSTRSVTSSPERAFRSPTKTSFRSSTSSSVHRSCSRACKAS